MGFCTFDSGVHYYNLKSSLSQPQMLVVPDHADPFLPVPDDLLVNLSESRAVVDTLVENLAQASIWIWPQNRQKKACRILRLWPVILLRVTQTQLNRGAWCRREKQGGGGGGVAIGRFESQKRSFLLYRRIVSPTSTAFLF